VCRVKENPVDPFSPFVQAEILAQYKPTIDKKTLIAELKRSDKFAADALVNFKNTRHVVLYYEDVVRSRTVSCCCFMSVC
jgi:hypothetical protein